MPKIIYNSDISRFEHLWKDGYAFKTLSYIRGGWDLYRKRAMLFSSYGVLFILFGTFVSAMANVASPVVALLLIQIYISGFYIGGNKIKNNEELNFSDLFDGILHFKQFLWLFLIYAGILLVAFVPALILTWYEYHIIEPYLLTYAHFSTLILAGIILTYTFSIWLFVTPGVVLASLRAWPAMTASRKILQKRIFSAIVIISMKLLIENIFPSRNFAPLRLSGFARDKKIHRYNV